MTVKNSDLFLIDSPMGRLEISLDKQGTFISIDILPQAKGPELSSEMKVKSVSEEFDAYFKDPLHIITIPLKLHGTPFQMRVWEALQQIPSGQVVSYGDVAKLLATSARAVGNACRANPCPIVVPCHRVVAAKGLGGYSGQTEGEVMDRKVWLLRHEGVVA